MPRLDRRHGIIDFEVVDVDGIRELSRARLFETKGQGCTLIHLAVRWEGVDDRGWEEHKLGTDADLLNAKQIIEGAS